MTFVNSTVRHLMVLCHVALLTYESYSVISVRHTTPLTALHCLVCEIWPRDHVCIVWYVNFFYLTLDHEYIVLCVTFDHVTTKKSFIISNYKPTLISETVVRFCIFISPLETFSEASELFNCVNCTLICWFVWP